VNRRWPPSGTPRYKTSPEATTCRLLGRTKETLEARRSSTPVLSTRYRYDIGHIPRNDRPIWPSDQNRDTKTGALVRFHARPVTVGGARGVHTLDKPLDQAEGPTPANIQSRLQSRYGIGQGASLIGLLSLLHGATNSQIRTLTASAADPAGRTVHVSGRPLPTPLDPATWAALTGCLAHRDQLRTLNPHVIVSGTTPGWSGSAVRDRPRHTPGAWNPRPARRHSPNCHTHPTQSPAHGLRATGTKIKKVTAKDPG
jgi:hypothetical protein